MNFHHLFLHTAPTFRNSKHIFLHEIIHSLQKIVVSHDILLPRILYVVLASKTRKNWHIESGIKLFLLWFITGPAKMQCNYYLKDQRYNWVDHIPFLTTSSFLSVLITNYHIHLLWCEEWTFGQGEISVMFSI